MILLLALSRPDLLPALPATATAPLAGLAVGVLVALDPEIGGGGERVSDTIVRSWLGCETEYDGLPSSSSIPLTTMDDSCRFESQNRTFQSGPAETKK